jgi:hypothetical protein
MKRHGKSILSFGYMSKRRGKPHQEQGQIGEQWKLPVSLRLSGRLLREIVTEYRTRLMICFKGHILKKSKIKRKKAPRNCECNFRDQSPGNPLGFSGQNYPLQFAPRNFREISGT